MEERKRKSIQGLDDLILSVKSAFAPHLKDEEVLEATKSVLKNPQQVDEMLKDNIKLVIESQEEE